MLEAGSTTPVESAIQEELQQYLNEKGVDTLFIKIVESLLMTKPENPVAFMVDYLVKNFPDEIKDTKRLDVNRIDSFQESSEIETKEDTDIFSDEESESDEDEYIADLPEQKVSSVGGRGRRVSVSAGVMNLHNLQQKTVKFPKTPEEEETLKRILGKTLLCSQLDDADLMTIVDAMEKKHVAPDVEIITQGDKVAEHFFILQEGEAVVIKDDAQIVEYGQGDSFGELALMYNAPRAATIKTKTECTVWRLGQQLFKAIVMGSAIKKRETINNFLQEVSILAEMTEHERMVLADSMQERKVPKGEEICQQGDKGDEFFIILDGHVSVLVNGNDVGTLESGQYFGEIALLTNKPRQATIIAGTEVKLLSVHRKVFQRVLGPLSDMLKRNMKAYSQYVAGVAI